MTTTRVSVCEKCGVTYADRVDKDAIIPCPVCTISLEHRRLNAAVFGTADFDAVREMQELIKDLQAQIDDLSEGME